MHLQRLYHILIHKLATCLVSLSIAGTSFASNIYDYLPEDALGFACLHNLESVDSKVQKISALTGAPIPPPLAFVKMTTGLDEGIDKQGSLLFALLPGETPTSEPLPMALLPISDYSKFANSVQGDASGEICRIPISGEEVLLAKHNDYALLMNVEHRETMEVMLELESESVNSISKLVPWMSTNDIVVAVMPEGAKLLTKLGKAKLSEFQEIVEKQLANNPQMATSLQQTRAGFQVYYWLLDFMDAEVELVTWGLSVDEEINLCLGKRVLLKKSGELASLNSITPSSDSIFQGFADQEFVFAGGGPFPPHWAEAVAKASSGFIKSMPEIYGLEDVEEDIWQKVEDSYLKLMQGTKSISLLMVPGEKDSPMMSGFYGTSKVANSDEYFVEWNKAIELYNEVFSQSTTFNMQYEVQPITIADKDGYEMATDMAEMMRDPNVPQFNWILESMFGEDGKLRYLFIPTNKETIAMGMSNDKFFKDFINGLDQETGLQENGYVKKTLEQLDAKAPWKMVISPSGSIKWVNRLVNELFGLLAGGQNIPIPEFPASPPVGISMKIDESVLEADLVWPGETLEALAEFIKNARQMN